jgi:hypothetical protein
MEPLDRYLTLVKHMTPIAFAKQESGVYLLKRPTKSKESAELPAQISFVTVHATLEVDPFAAQWRIVPIRKREGNPYADRISVGRASNCDVVLRVPFVSKVQAHILRETDGTFSLRAQNTANATFLNNRSIEASATCPLTVGDEIAFGPMRFEFVDAPRLYKVLVSEAR